MNKLQSSTWYGLTPVLGRLPYRVAVAGAGVLTFLTTIISTQLITATPWLLAACATAPLFWMIYRGEPSEGIIIDPVAIACAAFVGWAGLTLFWSPGGAEGFASWVRLCIFLSVTLVTRAAMGAIDPGARRAIGWAFVFAIGVASIVAFVDAGWNLTIRRFLMSVFGGARAELGAVIERGWVVQLQSHETNKSMSVLFSLIWPALLVAAALVPGGIRRLAVIAVVVLFAIAAALSDNETVKLALAVSTVAFLLVRWRPDTTRWLLGVGWVTCTLAMLPMVLALTTARVQEIDAIQDSGRHQIGRAHV